MSRSPMSPHTMEPDNNSAQPHMKRGYRDPDQLCIWCWVAAPACWQCVPHCVPPGVSTHRRRIPHCRPLISVSPAHYAPTRRWGRWLGAFKYSVAGGEKQGEWNVDNAMGIRGNQGDSDYINWGGNSGSSTSFYFMGLLFGWPSQSQLVQKIWLPSGLGSV